MKKSDSYFLGLDIGTNSVGWAVTDENYNIKKFNGKSMWGIRLFEEGQSAEDRRVHRATRRRNMRKVQRIKLLQELFSDEISKLDSAFYQRMKNSKYHLEDKEINHKFSLFNDINFNDKDYHDLYPTIYHLRSELVHTKEKKDIRLIYLALHHILKHRGHFLFEGKEFDVISDFKNVFVSLINELNDNWHLDMVLGSTDKIEKIIKDTQTSITDRRKELQELIYSESEGKKNKQIKTIISVIIGSKVSLNDLLNDTKYIKDNNKKKKEKINFRDGKFEEKHSEYEDMLGEDIYYVDKLKSIYDWGILESMLNSNDYLSDAKVEVYEKHRKDLRLLKDMVKKYVPIKYKEVFKSFKEKANYTAYVGNAKKSTNSIDYYKNKCSQEDFLKYLKNKVFKKVNVSNDKILQNMLNDIKSGTFMPKSVSKDNSVIPYQLHLIELNVILKNAEKHYEFLNEKDGKYSISEKVKKLLTFRIPYYVGPLNDAHKKEDISNGYCWISKKSGKEDIPIRPWNFDEVVDIDKCAEDFITRMTSKCTYLIGADVLPKDSLLYSEFMVHNELNNLRINGERISNKLKTKIFNDLFKSKKKVSQKALKQYLKINGYGENNQLTGIDGDFKANLSSYIDFKKIIGEKVNNNKMIEEIIRAIVLFGDDKKLLKRRISEEFGNNLSKSEIKKISSLSYSGWGRLSKEFLTDIIHVNKTTGECINIINALRNNVLDDKPQNLMELLSSKFDFMYKIKEYNNNLTNSVDKLDYSLLDELYVSPAVKRSIWQSLVITDEIVKIMKKEPKKIFLEMARGNNGPKKRTISRRQKLIDLYKSVKDDTRNWGKELEGKTDGNLRSTRLYLYYTQMGKCMYSGESISVNDLFDKNIYDIDHIYPQSKVKDDSLSNKVLVKRECNMEKGNGIVPSKYQNKMINHWKRLLKLNFISKRKFDRLSRKTEFNNRELSGFIARQVVETRQSTKAVSQLISKLYTSDIVYVKAGNVSRFRHHFDIIKVRDINDYHHAKDAYLNIVVGNVYDVKFTRNPFTFIKEGNKYSLNEKVLFGNDVLKNGYYAWKENETIKLVKSYVYKNNIRFTRLSFEQKGQLFDVNPKRRGKGQLSLKGSDKNLRNIKNYGGYNSIKGAYFCYVEHKKKKKIVRSIEYVPIYLANQIRDKPKRLNEYLIEELGLRDHKVLLSKIKINSLFKVDGFLMHLTGRTNKQLIFKNALQLVISKKQEEYLKKVFKYNERVQIKKKLKKEIGRPTEYDGISYEKNLDIYNMLFHKISKTIYSKRLSSQIEKFKTGKSVFKELSRNEQCELICEAIKLFQCNPVTSNLKLIGGVANAGKLLMSKNIVKGENCNVGKKISIIHQSPTGLFEQEVDVLEI